jgi:hypothetical protein
MEGAAINHFLSKIREKDKDLLKILRKNCALSAVLRDPVPKVRINLRN